MISIEQSPFALREGLPSTAEQPYDTVEVRSFYQALDQPQDSYRSLIKAISKCWAVSATGSVICTAAAVDFADEFLAPQTV